MNRDVGLFLISLPIGLIICMLVFGGNVFFEKEIHMVHYNTYFVFNPFELASASVGFVLVVVFIFRLIQARFKERLPWMFFCGGIYSSSSLRL